MIITMYPALETAAVTILMLLLVFEQHVALHLEGYKTHSEVERAVITRYFLFNLANVFVTIGVGPFAEVSWFYFISPFVCLVLG